MFERTKVDNRVADAERNAAVVEIGLEDGQTLAGRLCFARTRGLADELNSAGGFVEFEAFTGEREYLAKARIRGIRPVNPPGANQLDARLRLIDGFDPHQILEIAAGADRDTIRAAYHRLAKTYHPDRLSGFDLPPEMVDYASAVSRRLNAAYSLLLTTLQPPVPQPKLKSPPRWDAAPGDSRAV